MNSNRQGILRKIMNRNGRAVLLVLVAALAFSGCGGAGGNAVNDNAGRAASSNVNASSPAPAADGAANVAQANNAAVAPAPMTPTGGGATQAGATPAGGTRGNSNAPPANMPKPQIGSGGSDFSLFAQTRGALDADAELKAANITIEVKEGVVSLGGTVANAAQKSKAEQLVLAVGPKAVKNQIRVSGGK